MKKLAMMNSQITKEILLNQYKMSIILSWIQFLKTSQSRAQLCREK